MDETTSNLYDKVVKAFQEWEQLDGTKHYLCPKVDDEDDEDYTSPGPPITTITAEEKAQRIQDAHHRTELTYQLSLLLGIAYNQSGGLVEQWSDGIERCLTKCDACILNYHMQRKTFLKKLRE